MQHINRRTDTRSRLTTKLAGSTIGVMLEEWLIRRESWWHGVMAVGISARRMVRIIARRVSKKTLCKRFGNEEKNPLAIENRNFHGKSCKLSVRVKVQWNTGLITDEVMLLNRAFILESRLSSFYGNLMELLHEPTWSHPSFATSNQRASSWIFHFEAQWPQS